MTPMILVLGPQGSGKGTQVARLAAEYQLPSVSAGELLRAAAKESSALGRAIDARLKAGQLVTIDQWTAIVGAYLDRAELAHGYLIEGVVRTIEQVGRFDQLLAARSLTQPWVLSLTLPDDVAVERLVKRGRSDDTEAAIRARLSWSRSEVEPVLEHYRQLGRLIEVNGDQPIDAVYADVVAGLTVAGALPGNSR